MSDSQKSHYVVATGIIIKDDKYLITKRADWEKAFPGKWTVPGGKLVVDDYINKPKDTKEHWYNILEILLKREVKEETNLDIKNIKYLTSMTFIRPDNIPVLIISLYADYHSGEVALSKDMTDYAWVSLEEAKNYDLIEGIYEELEMLDNLLRGNKQEEWKKNSSIKSENFPREAREYKYNPEIIEKIRAFVEEECKKPTSKYGYEPYIFHFNSVNKYAKLLAKHLNADSEIVEIASWLHDIGSIIHGRENHHITGVEIAEKKLKELDYPEEKINKIKHCIYSHRGSKDIKRETIEAQILADADTMANFDNISGIFKAAFVYEGLNQENTRQSVKTKLINSYNKISAEAKEIVKPKFEAAMLLFGEDNNNNSK